MGGSKKSLKLHKRVLAIVVSALMVESMIPQEMIQPSYAATDQTLAVNDQIDVTTEENNKEVSRRWQLVWNDEFDESSLDRTKWGYQVGTGAEYVEDGWGNKEQEYYTDGENTKIEDGNLVITAKKNTDQSKYAGKAYTSARLWTKGSIDAKENGVNEPGTSGGPALFAKKYGRFEASISLPEGTGYWPAFWLMPAYDKYGNWAASGELDIMEARGREINKVDGTVHYGDVWPNNKSNGGHYEDANFDITQKHLYAVEWEPGEIRWYVDNILYYKTNEFYAHGSGTAENYTYPAPFDQPFYIILNLAVGGNYDSGQLDETINNGEMKVDYVRVYDEVNSQNEVGNYNENVMPIEKEVTELHGGEGNLTSSSMETINKVVNDYAMEGSNGWDLLALKGFGGDANATYIDGGAKIQINNPGTQDYSIQLTHKLPLTYGYGYQVSLKAKADSKRSIKMKLGEAGGGYAPYTDTANFDLTNEWKEYTFDFNMLSDTDDAARLELNLGLNASSVQIKDVVVKSIGKIKEQGENDSKEPTQTGEQIYNGTFDQGNNIDEQSTYTRLKYWNDINTNATVDSTTREVKLVSKGYKDSALTQQGIQLLNKDSYELNFKARAEQSRSMEVVVRKTDGTIYESKKIELTAENTAYNMNFEMKDSTDNMAEIEFIVGEDKTPVYLDDISLKRTTNYNIDYSNIKLYLVENGDFKAGMAGWSKHQTEAGIDSVDNEKVAWVAAAPCMNNYDMMFMYNDLVFEQGIQYTMKFKAKTTGSNDQKITLRIQREGGDWKSVLDQEFMTSSDWKEYEYHFTPDFSGNLNLKYLLGGVSSGCNFNLKDVELYVTDKPKLQSAFFYDQGTSKVGENVIVSYINHNQWDKTEKKAFYINQEIITEADYTVDEEKNQIVFNERLFKEAGNYSIQAIVDGYDKSNIVMHVVHDASGNLLVNGSFEQGLNGWGSYFTNNCGQVNDTEDKEAKVSFIWHEGNPWDLQLFQDGIVLQQGKKYQIQFMASASINRDMTIEFGKLSGATPLATVSLTKDRKEYSFNYNASSDEVAKLNFLMGNVNGCSNQNNPHDIYIDDVIVKEVVEEQPTESPKATVEPTKTPELEPTLAPTKTPDSSIIVTQSPAPTESAVPTVIPTESAVPTVIPTESVAPTVMPTESVSPTVIPTESPSPILVPTKKPNEKKASVTNLHVAKQTSNSITVTWDKKKEINICDVAIYQGKKCINKKRVRTSQYTLKKLTPATKYLIKVKPLNGVSKLLSWATAPGKVNKISIKKKADGSYQISWKKVSRASGYLVIERTQKNKLVKKLTNKKVMICKTNTKSFMVKAYKKVGKKKIYSVASKLIKIK